MVATYEPIVNRKNASFQVSKFDNSQTCNHEGLHFHDKYEIVFIKNGSGQIIVENHCHEYKNGALIFLGPCLPHFSFYNNSFEDNYEVVVHFDEQFVDERISLIPEFFALGPFIHKSSQVMIFDNEFKEDQQEIFQDLHALSPLEQLSKLYNFFCQSHISQKFTCLLEAPSTNPFQYKNELKEIFDYINHHYSESISTRDIAKHLNLTTNSFCRLFKRITGKSFITYINEYRIHRAAQLIEFSSNNISEIAFQCGFENMSYFSKVFFKVKNYKPVDYRKACRKQ